MAYQPAPAPEIISVDPSCSGVKCDGGSAALGHPEVYYSFDGASEVVCGYCGRVFVKQA
ncbi:MAG: zinc-finger domain-containing protein [Pseudobdellovibrionaceae bacterium]